MRYILLTTIFLTSIFAQGQMDRRNMSDADKMEVRKQRMEQLSNQKESAMIGVQTSYLNLTPDQAQKFFPMQNEVSFLIDFLRHVKKVSNLLALFDQALVTTLSVLTTISSCKNLLNVDIF